MNLNRRRIVQTFAEFCFLYLAALWSGQEFSLADVPALTPVNVGLPALNSPSGAWGDYDNDGDLDLILAGFDNLVGPRFELWRNDHGLFTKAVGTGFPQGIQGTAVWGDYDNDGQLDLALNVQDA